MTQLSDGEFIGLVVGVVALLIVAVVIGAVWFDSYKCDQLGEVTGKETSFRIASGCYVKVRGRWIPRDSWRGEQEQ